MTTEIYMESSIRGPRPKKGVVGFVLQENGTTDPKSTFGFFDKEVTANYSNMVCLKEALKRINPSTGEVILHTTSGYINLSLLRQKKNQGFEDFEEAERKKEIKYAKDWEEIRNYLQGKTIEVKLNEPHEYKHWLQREVQRRAEKYL